MRAAGRDDGCRQVDGGQPAGRPARLAFGGHRRHGREPGRRHGGRDFRRDGEAVFRAAEAQAIAELGSVDGPLMVSVGGGAVLSETNRAAMRAAGTVVWLRAGPATLAARVGSGTAGPSCTAAAVTPQAALEQLAAEREAYYEEVADLVVDVDGISPQPKPLTW